MRAARIPSPIVGAMANWQASRIKDPVVRLRFLRRTVGDRRVWDPRTETGRVWLRKRGVSLAVAFAALVLVPAGTVKSAGRLWWRGPILSAQASMQRPDTFPQVWQVDQQGEYETYSNGLRIERKYEVSNEPRQFAAYRRSAEEPTAKEDRTAPVGIVFHTTESAQTDFTEGETRRIRMIGAALLDFIQKERAYHYVVDRFGRVWRVVKESDAANHAGYSIWADDTWTYVNLNRSFVGVSVETMTQPGSSRAEATPAQIHALRVLTEMLRSKYRILSTNCVTHAQVSVNPSNMQAGYHYDWAANFPYPQVGLPDNYALATPSLWLFGFTYDPSLVNVTGEPFWKGLVLGAEQLRQNATAHGMDVSAYRRILESRYRQILSTLKSKTELSKEKQG